MSDPADPTNGQDPGSGNGAGQVTGDPAAGQSPSAGSPGPTAVQLALEAGWTMAVLYGRINPGPAGGLPTANELRENDRRTLELDRLRHLLTSLAQMPEFSGSGLPVEVPSAVADVAALREALTKLNFDILCALAAAGSPAQLAYELGRSLRDTANPPDPRRTAEERPGAHQPGENLPGQHPPATALSRQFGRGRIAAIQGWLATLSSELPPRAAAVVSASLGRWSEFVAVTAGTPAPRLKHREATAVPAATPGASPGQADDATADDATAVDAAISSYLLRQGDLWLMLLTGKRATSGLLTPDGYVAAGELALRRSAAIIRRILQHYWAALLTGAVALGVILYLAATYLVGAAKVWTMIAGIAGSLGISARTITSAAARVATEAEHPVFSVAEEDVMAWAITTMPPLRLPSSRVRQLRKAGIAPTSSLGRI